MARRHNTAGNNSSGRSYARGMPLSPVRTVVLARNLKAFHAWCASTGTSPRDRSVLYASGPHVLRGLGQVEIVRFGDWWDRLDEAALTKAISRLQASSQPEEAAA